MVYCCVPYCKSERGRTKNVTFHELPSDNSQRALWLKNISRMDWTPNGRSVVCSLHFKLEDFRSGLKRKTLVKDAFPSIFDKYPSYMQRSIQQKAKKRKPPTARDSSMVKKLKTRNSMGLRLRKKLADATGDSKSAPVPGEQVTQESFLSNMELRGQPNHSSSRKRKLYQEPQTDQATSSDIDGEVEPENGSQEEPNGDIEDHNNVSMSSQNILTGSVPKPLDFGCEEKVSVEATVAPHPGADSVNVSSEETTVVKESSINSTIDESGMVVLHVEQTVAMEGKPDKMVTFDIHVLRSEDTPPTVSQTTPPVMLSIPQKPLYVIPLNKEPGAPCTKKRRRAYKKIYAGEPETESEPEPEPQPPLESTPSDDLCAPRTVKNPFIPTTVLHELDAPRASPFISREHDYGANVQWLQRRVEKLTRQNFNLKRNLKTAQQKVRRLTDRIISLKAKVECLEEDLS